MTAKQNPGVYAPDGSLYITLTDGAGNLATAGGGGSGTPGGSTTQVQYNNAGAFGGISGATTNGTALTLVAPILGAATGTSLALNGATLGSDKLSVTGSISGSTSINAGTSLAGAVNGTGTGSINLAGGVDGYVDGTQWSLKTGTYLGWSSTTNAIAANDVRISRASAGVLQVGTTANNALGALNLANLTATSVVDAGTLKAPTLRVSNINSNDNAITAFTIANTTGNVALSTTLAIGGATIGSNALAVTGTSALGITSVSALTSTSVTNSTYVWLSTNADNRVIFGASLDTNISRVSAGVLGVGTGAQGSVAGSLNLTNLTATGAVTAGLTSSFGFNFGTANTNMYAAVSGFAFSIAGNTVANIAANGIKGSADAVIGWTSNVSNAGSTIDTMFSRAAAAVVQLGAADVASGAVAQTLQVQSNTGTTTTGPDFIIIGAGGTSVGGNIIFKTKATTTAATAITINAAGVATFANSTVFSNDITLAAGSQVTWSSNGALRWVAANNLRISNAAATDFGLLQFGGTTSSFPALKRNAAVLEVKLADDSAYTQVYGATVRTSQTTVAGLPSASTSGAGARAFVTDASTTLVLGLGGTVAGGGANKVPVYSDGTNWVYG